MGLLENFTFNMNTGVLTHDCSCLAGGTEISAATFSGNYQYRNDRNSSHVVSQGAIPLGRYFITEPYLYKPNSPFGSDTFYKLFKDDGSPDDQTDVVDPSTGLVRTRGKFRFHPGSYSIGCVTVPKEDKKAWQRIEYLLKKTKVEFIPGTNIPYYGTLTVR
jgi:hypothetical protein